MAMMMKLAVALTYVSLVMGMAVPPEQQAHRETLAEAAVNTKKLVHRYTTGTMASVFPDTSDNAGRPFALMEYHAPCHPSPSLTFLLLPISLSTSNILHTDHHYATYTVTTPPEGARTPMSQGRVAFMGNITLLPDLSHAESQALAKCYTQYHPDARWWLPDTKGSPHVSIWARFDVDDIYYVGGFGDTHYIGHIPTDLYARAGEKKIEQEDEASGLGEESQIVF
ncbi:hypothetical protein CI109_103201 [Kwoniella shandongensis]|uniref:CREG-like beta-barrel domain-containing protein n=1 Tax=Kwoniella shandongensis TaxID=1734106 RepID=A0A5M6CEL9_9TREE|nr:uncharacterized protein CI109_000391 [Kwoniella shandongensis]KAA5531549.1 hypothetical protein CI109_000391 [Kwoniella shandongensis]